MTGAEDLPLNWGEDDRCVVCQRRAEIDSCGWCPWCRQAHQWETTTGAGW